MLPTRTPKKSYIVGTSGAGKLSTAVAVPISSELISEYCGDLLPAFSTSLRLCQQNG